MSTFARRLDFRCLLLETDTVSGVYGSVRGRALYRNELRLTVIRISMPWSLSSSDFSFCPREYSETELLFSPSHRVLSAFC